MTKHSKEPQVYQSSKTAAELGITCIGGNTGNAYGLPVVWFDHAIGEKNYLMGFVRDNHGVSD
jgi:hypothetical protein